MVRKVAMVTYRGREMPVEEACRLAGLSRSTYRHRRRAGWPANTWFAPYDGRAVELRAGSKRVCLWHEGNRITLAEASRRTGVPNQVISMRRKAGWPEDQWLIPVMKRGERR